MADLKRTVAGPRLLVDPGEARLLVGLIDRWRALCPVDGPSLPETLRVIRSELERVVRLDESGRGRSVPVPPMVDPAEVAERLGCSRAAVVELLHDGELIGSKYGGWQVLAASIDAYERRKAVG